MKQVQIRCDVCGIELFHTNSNKEYKSWESGWIHQGFSLPYVTLGEGGEKEQCASLGGEHFCSTECLKIRIDRAFPLKGDVTDIDRLIALSQKLGYEIAKIKQNDKPTQENTGS